MASEYDSTGLPASSPAASTPVCAGVRTGDNHGVKTGGNAALLNRRQQEGYSTGGGLGLGLPGIRRLMDEFVIDSKPDKGTTVITTKWIR